jgi:hypothetical protein
MASGEAHVICGTHALFQEAVEFHDLALVVIDEQHRFGVSDRRRLTLKGAAPDVLAMSATPIPRTLTLAAFGDLDVSRLDEKPAGRIPPDTRVVSAQRLSDVVDGLKRALAQWRAGLLGVSAGGGERYLRPRRRRGAPPHAGRAAARAPGGARAWPHARARQAEGRRGFPRRARSMCWWPPR